MRAVSFHPDDAYRGFDLPEGIIEITNAYTGITFTGEHTQVGLILTVKAADGSETDLRLNAGFLRDLIPSIDGDEACWSEEEKKYLPGRYLVGNPSAERPRHEEDGKVKPSKSESNSNLMFFNEQLVNEGFPKDGFVTEDGYPRPVDEIYIGLKGALKQQGNTHNPDKKKPGEFYKCVVLTGLEGGAAAAAPGSAAAAKPAATAKPVAVAKQANGAAGTAATTAVAPASPSAGNDLNEIAEAWALAVIAKNGPRTPVELANDFYGMSLAPHPSLGKLTQDTRRNIRALFKSDEYLAKLAESGGVTFEGGKVGAVA